MMNDMEVEREAAALVAQMTLEEKTGLLSGSAFWFTKAVARLGLERAMLCDGPHGLRKQEAEADHMGTGGSRPSTCFPAGGTIAANLAANANPDGYTLLSVSSAHAVAPAIYAKLPYDARRDLMGVSLSAVSKYVLVSSPSGFRSMKDLLTVARSKPGSLNFSSAGVGSGTHFAGELLKSMAKIDVVHTPL